MVEIKMDEKNIDHPSYYTRGKVECILIENLKES